MPSELSSLYAAARAHALDRYLAALLAPRPVRDDLVTLAALAGELERIPLLVSEPALGEIRLQWWAEWLDRITFDPAAVSGNPLADRMASVIARNGLPVSLLERMIEARRLELYSDAAADWAGFRRETAEAELGAFAMAGAVLQRQADPLRPRASILCAETAGAAAREAAEASPATLEPAPYEPFALAYGLVRKVIRLPQFVARGRWPLPLPGDEPIDPSRLAEPAVASRLSASRAEAIAAASDTLAAARAADRALPAGAFVAVLPVALVEPHLRALQDESDWLRRPSDILPLTRVWRLWRARMVQRI